MVDISVSATLFDIFSIFKGRFCSCVLLIF
ncbi:hypothetical protein JOD02_001468 [Caldicoprobacter guelmensis]|nr:hypothetical protein [Caldicoprobacter guelmensis]